MREEEARMDLLHDNHMEEAETTERQARVAKEEAARLALSSIVQYIVI